MKLCIDVRKDVLAATSGKQVPWDHSALTGDFYFQLAAAPQAMPKPASPEPADTATLQERLRRLEEELKRKYDSSDTAATVLVAQLKERRRQLDESIRQDWQRVFEVQRSLARETDAKSRSVLQSEVSKIHLNVARKGQELRGVNSEIARLEEEKAGNKTP
jgi:hypothetical protein